MFGLSTCGKCGEPVTFVVGQPEFLEVTKHSLSKGFTAKINVAGKTIGKGDWQSFWRWF
jgi:hypothetical protein